MLRRKAAIVFAIIGIGTVLGFIAGVAPGYFLTSYALFGIGAGFLLFLFLLMSVTTFVYEYLNKISVALTTSKHIQIFHEGLSRTDKILISFTVSGLFFGGAVLGVIFELLFKAISASTAAHVIIAAIFIIILLVALVIILIIALKKSKVNHDTQQRVIDEKQPVIIEPIQHSPKLTKAQDGPRNTASRAFRHRSRPLNDDSKLTWQDSSVNSSMTDFTNISQNSKTLSTIQKEYQRLLHPTPHFNKNEKVFVNNKDLAQIISADGSGNYIIKHLDSGIVEYKNGADLRKALPLIK